MKKSKVLVRDKRIDIICCILSIVYFIAIIISINSLVTYTDMCETLGTKIDGFAMFGYVSQLIILIVAWVFTIYILIIISSNRKLIHDLTVILNELEMTSKGIDKVLKNENDNFISKEFYDCCKDLEENIYCECGNRILKGQAFCSRCGKKTGK